MVSQNICYSLIGPVDVKKGETGQSNLKVGGLPRSVNTGFSAFAENLVTHV